MDIVGNSTLRDLWQELTASAGERPFLVFEDRDGHVREYTYSQFDTLINQTANLVRGLGVKPADAIVVHTHNCPELLMCLFAAAKIGALLVPIHPRSTFGECQHVWNTVQAKIVVCEEQFADLYGKGALAAEHVLVARSDTIPAGATSFAHGRDNEPAFLVDRPELTSDDPVAIVFTSGTTARPKGVVLTQANLLFSGYFVNWQAAMSSDDRLLTTMPACHVNFQLNALMPVLTAGATLIAVEHYSARRFWRQVRAHDATIVQSIAMMVRTMLLQPVDRGDTDHRVREVLYYLPITDAEKELFEKRFGTRILNSYGTSETLVGVITDPPFGQRRWPSIGRPGLGYEARIMGPRGREAPARVVGEIQVRGRRGRTLMQGYYQNPEATAAAIDADGWVHTGDLGYVDEDGWFYFVDRMTHLIKRAGENISPAEVEAALMEHPGIEEAAVVGVADPMYDQAVCAYVVPTAGTTLTAQEVSAHCSELLAPFKVPTLITIVPALPLTSSFKVAKSALAVAEPPAALGPRGTATAKNHNREEE